MNIRPYHSNDLLAVLNLFDQNTPTYFAPSEREDLIRYLKKEREDYFVVEENSQVIGAGGINYFPAEGITRISWDIIEPDLQGKGVGTKLVHHRIDHIEQNSSIEKIVVRTSQLVAQFYKKMGFKIVSEEKNYWGKGLNLVVMEK